MRRIIHCGKGKPIDLWLMLMKEGKQAWLLCGDYAGPVWVAKECCERLPNGQFRMPEPVAVVTGLEWGCT